MLRHSGGAPAVSFREFYQLTFGDLASLNPTATDRARTFAFESRADHLLNGNSNPQVFFALETRFEHPADAALQQLTRGAGESFAPQLNASGGFLVLSSTSDFNGAGLPQGSTSPSREAPARRSSCTT